MGAIGAWGGPWTPQKDIGGFLGPIWGWRGSLCPIGEYGGGLSPIWGLGGALGPRGGYWGVPEPHGRVLGDILDPIETWGGSLCPIEV